MLKLSESIVDILCAQQKLILRCTLARSPHIHTDVQAQTEEKYTAILLHKQYIAYVLYTIYSITIYSTV